MSAGALATSLPAAGRPARFHLGHRPFVDPGEPHDGGVLASAVARAFAADLLVADTSSAGRSQPLPLPPPKASRRAVAAPLRDWSHGSSPSHVPGVIVRRGRATARATLAKAAALLAQRLRTPVPAGTAAVPLLLCWLSAS